MQATAITPATPQAEQKSVRDVLTEMGKNAGAQLREYGDTTADNISEMAGNLGTAISKFCYALVQSGTSIDALNLAEEELLMLKTIHKGVFLEPFLEANDNEIFYNHLSQNKANPKDVVDSIARNFLLTGNLNDGHLRAMNSLDKSRLNDDQKKFMKDSQELMNAAHSNIASKYQINRDDLNTYAMSEQTSEVVIAINDSAHTCMRNKLERDNAPQQQTMQPNQNAMQLPEDQRY